MRIAVVPATYNRPDMLTALLEGYLAQDYRDFEIIIADDGSGEATSEVITRYQRCAPFRIAHVWQENRGYRAATIRNKAVAQANADYVIFTDQDCIPRPDFLSSHARLAERGWFVAGNRVLLAENFSRHVAANSGSIHDLKFAQWLYRMIHGDINRIQPLIKLPDGVWRKLHPARWRGAKTCNLAVWHDDLVDVNGMDESYSGWGLEDSDLVIRLIHSGVGHKSGRYACPVFHLWHRESSRDDLEANRLRLQQVLNSTHIRAAQGLDQYC
ncbi:MAG: glycosyl transferase family 2 [Gallionellales bacterium GWA2_55_18]|nr:MAG: glycosyl transferase family 2 [Gallionellales bacterium GWA2_55_18]